MKFVDLQAQYQAYKMEIDHQISDVLNTSAFIMGPAVKELEQQLAEYVDVKHAIGCSSGTDALLLSLMAYNIQPGDEVVTTPFTFISTAEVISLLGAKPVFVDVEEDTFNIDPNKIESVITDKTRGIIVVDIFGQCADYTKINAIAKKNNFFVIEDAAQSFGAKYNDNMACSLADTGCTSFFPAKPFGCYGDGGMIFTDDEEKASVLRSLLVHGKGGHKYENVRIGINGRLDTLQAAILLAKFKYFPKEIERRNEIARTYSEGLSSTVRTPFIENFNVSAWAQYSILVDNRDALQVFLKGHNVPTAIYYPNPLHIQTAFAELGYKKGDFPVTEELSEKIISLPMHPFLKPEEQKEVINQINQFYSKG
ncbi:MAG: DegT/DnrJ/EryC1/StrS family aminotransferase [Candidatus Omnitrophica bacterium]|nr:DegT/DnrJ/EryC1/StrS family aminotransferase [Candidatus Omnitrophota bacterium]